MIAAILPLIPLLAPLIPRLADWIGGDDAEDVARQVTSVVTAVAGSTDPATVAAAIADPERAGLLVAEMARIGAERERVREEAQTARLAQVVADMANARQQTVQLVQAGSRLAWMPAIITCVLLLTFGAVLGFVFLTTIPDANTRLVDQLIGGLYTLVTMSVSYWVGTSRGAVEMRQGLEKAAHGDAAPQPFAR
jgi:predicted regulator of Ras-like GTPase activity (Roadblock/LC7/MglB family)